MSNYEINDLDRFAAIFKALASPHRLQLFQLLTGCCPPGSCCRLPLDDEQPLRRCVGELGESLAVAPSTLSHHLKAMHEAGLIKMERHGKSIECWVDPEILITVANFFHPQTSAKKPTP